ncbi:MAG: NAD-dependent succinate-semialdehyde dehydrogenase [Cellvibrionales bacterium]|nr:NAD-dependent succinate-semialdehyde dehydrogenase [Cellvibrionales bacterium]
MSLFKSLDSAFIDGEWIKSSDTSIFPVFNPASLESITQVPNCTKNDAIKAIESAKIAFRNHAKTSAFERSNWLMQWYTAIEDNKAALAELVTQESGKPLAEAIAEVQYAASFFQWFAESIKRPQGEIISPSTTNKRLMTIKQPIGVVAGITPWNFPIAMLAKKVAPAIAAGCSFVLKPAAETPLSALALAKLSKQTDLPKGLFNVVTSTHSADIGDVFTTHEFIKKITFTGSTEVGKKLLAQSADTIKSTSMELGGNAPFIIFDDADLDTAVDGLMVSKFRNSGQTCVCANRVFVHNALMEDFLQKLTDKVNLLSVGNGLDEGSTIGPLINQNGFDKVATLVQAAIEQGATCLVGGKPHNKGGTYFEPTILTGVTDSMAITQTEIFGPVVPVLSFTDETDVIARANDTPYGLAAYFFSQNLNRVFRVSEQLKAGIIGINEGMISHANVPFGGVKASGIGREGADVGLEAYLETKSLCIGNVA